VRVNVARARPDIVHAHLGAADFFGALATQRLGLPMVSTIHLMGGGNPGTQLRDRVKERLMARARRHGGARVIAVSEASRQAYLARGWDRPDHVVTVHNGIVPPQPRVDGAQMRAQLGLAPDALVVTMVTVLRPGKGHEAVAEAIARLLPRFPHLRLLVAGSGPSEAHVREVLAPLGDAALLLGHRSDVVELLGASDVLLHPTHMDAFPTALLEAGAMRLPVLASAVGGIPEIVVDGETGMLVPAPPQGAAVADALAPLLADAALRERLGSAARARFEQSFTATRWVERLRALYDAVLAERRAPRRR
jgi:glycosyltransferase involved in cell wall biosynthesis